MGGSQLSQLKTALAGAGLSRQNSGGQNGTKKKRSGVAAAKARMAGDAEARNRKLEVCWMLETTSPACQEEPVLCSFQDFSRLSASR
jgi:hypothetical protein